MTRDLLPILMSAGVAAAVLAGSLAAQGAPRGPDTLRLDVGSPAVNGGYYAPHVGRNTVMRIAGSRVDTTGSWTNTLVLGDSAGLAVHRWHTVGTFRNAASATVRFELWQTFDARTLALYGYHLRSELGEETRLAVNGRRVRGTRRPDADSAVKVVDFTLPRAGYPAAAADLIPPAVTLREGLVIVMPVWTVPTQAVVEQTWVARRRTTVPFEGRPVPAWEFDVHSATGMREGTVWFIDEPPYMVRWDVFGAQGELTRVIGVKARR